MFRPRSRFRVADVAQQFVGGFLLAGPFVVTEEVWDLAQNMTNWHALVVVGLVVSIGYGALYEADDDRDPENEPEVVGIPLRFISLMSISFGSVILLSLVVTAPDQFLGDLAARERAIVTTRAVAVGAIFSVVGAATADSVF
ncbi:MAG: DUF2391 family protein [Halapricum sp.]